jgi:hypothetical protein
MPHRTYWIIGLGGLLGLATLGAGGFAARARSRPAPAGRISSAAAPTSIQSQTVEKEENRPCDYLDGMVHMSSSIAVGTITAVMGNYPYLRDQPYDGGLPPQRTYAFTVEENLKGSAGTVGSTVTVVQFGGADLSSGTIRMEGVPWLVTGSRYILFFEKTLNTPGGDTAGYIQETDHNGAAGKVMELTDKALVDPGAQSAVLLSGGNTLPNSDGVYTATVTPFLDYPVFNITEAQAKANIATVVAQDP